VLEKVKMWQDAKESLTQVREYGKVQN